MKHKKSQIRSLSIFVLIVLLTSLSLGFTINETIPDSAPLSINETDVFTHDFNVNVNESLVRYEILLAQDSALEGSLAINENTGYLIINFPAFFMGNISGSQIFPADGLITIRAVNRTNQFDKADFDFGLDVTNINEPPIISNCNQPTGICNPSTNPQDVSAAENTTDQRFNITYYDLDPDGSWSDLTPTWYYDGVPNGFSAGNVSPYCTHNQTFASCVLDFGFDASGYRNLTVEIADGEGLFDRKEWNITVSNVGRPPYFTYNATSQDPIIETYQGFPLIQINEETDISFYLNYTDDDEANLNPEFEAYEVRAYFYENGTRDAAQDDTDLNKGSTFAFDTSYTTIIGGTPSELYNITVLIIDTVLGGGGEEEYITWYVNVSNINQPPTITEIRHGVGSATDVPENSTNNVVEGDTSTFEFDYTDIDANIVNATIYVNGSILTTENPLSSGDTTFDTRYWDYLESGVYNISFYVEDGDGLNDSSWILVNVSNNVAPVITSFTITNSTGGTTYYEGDEITVTYNYTDLNGNANVFEIRRNGTLLDEIPSGNTISASFTPTFTDRGDYNISIYVADSEPLNDSNSTIITVNPTEVAPQILSIQYVNETGGEILSTSEQSTVNSREGETILFEMTFSDQNGDNTLQTKQIFIDGIQVPGVYGGSVTYPTNSRIRFSNWNINFTDSGIRNVSFFANDTTGLNVSSWILLNITNNTAPNITEYNIFNSTNDLTNVFSENSTMYLNFTYEDTFDNINTINVTIDGVSIPYTQTDFVINSSYYFDFETAKDNYNVTVFISDDEGLSTVQTQFVNVSFTDVPPQISQLNITEADGTVTQIDVSSGDGQRFYVQEVNGSNGNNTVRVSFLATDLNNDINDSTATITFNGTPYVGSYSQLFELNLSSQGNYTLNVSVLDNTSLPTSNFGYFFLEVVDNIPPVINTITAQNVSEGTDLYENQSIDFVVDVSDSNSNINYVDLLFSGVFTNQYGLVYSDYVIDGLFLYTPTRPGFTTAGIYNFTAIVYDTEGFNDTFTQNFTILQTNRNPYVHTFFIENQNVLVDQTAISVFEANAVNFSIELRDDDAEASYNLDYAEVLIDGVLEVGACNQTLTGTSDFLECQWTPGQSDQGSRDITVNVYDNQGGFDAETFTITVQDNIVPIIENFTIEKNGLANTTFVEGETMNVTYDYFDENGNIDTFYVSINFSDGTEFFYDDNLTYTFQFNDRGTYNVTVYVNDTFGEFAEDSSIITVVPFEFNPQILGIRATELNGTTHDLSEGDTITIKQNYLKDRNTLNISLNASDQNGNDTLTMYNITINETSYEGANNNYIWQVDYSNVGLYTVNLTVTDSSLRSNSTFFYIDVINNTVPVIDLNLSVDQNSLEQIDENDTLDLNLSVSDIDSNIDSYYISFNGQIIASDSLATGGDISWQRYFNFTSAGNYDVIFFVNDSAGYNDTFTETITVNPTEVAPTIEDVYIEVNNIDQGYVLNNNLTLFETDLIRIEFTADDINEDLSSYDIYLDGSLNQTNPLNENVAIVWIWQTTYFDQGIRNVTFAAQDLDGGFNTTYTIFINLTDNLAPNISYFNITNTNGEVINNSNNAREGQTLTINATTFDDLNDFNNSENILIKIDGVTVAQNTSGEARSLNVSYDWYLDYNLTNTTREYNISIESYDDQGLNGTASKIVTVYHTPRNPTIEDIQVRILSNTAYDIGNGTVNVTDDDTNWYSITNGSTVIINETNTVYYRILASDENGDTTLRNVTFTLYDFISNLLISTDIDGYSVNNFNYTPSYSNSSIFFVNATVNDVDLNESMAYFILNVTNNTAPTIVNISITNQDGDICTDDLCEEGDTVTVNVTVEDDFSPVANITIFQRNQTGDVISTYVCISTYFCANDYFLDYTARGTWIFDVEVNDEEPLLITDNASITVQAVEIAPFLDTVNITSVLQNRSWILTENNFSCTGGTTSNRLCDYTGSILNFSETDDVYVSFNATDINEDDLSRSRIRLLGFDTNSFQYEQVDFSALNDLDKTFTLDASYFDDYGTQEMQFNTFIFDQPSGADFKLDFTINFTIINNVAPVLSNFTILNSTGGNLSFNENDLLNISFLATDSNNNFDAYRITLNTTPQTSVINNSLLFPLNYSSYGTYQVCIYANDTQPLTNSSCQNIVVNPINITPVIAQISVSNSSASQIITEGQTITTHEGVPFEINVSAYDLNGNNTIVYNISRNGTNSPLQLGATNESVWNIDFSQEGTYNVTVNLTTDRLNEENSTFFYITVINNTAPVLTYLNYTSNQTNLSEKIFVEGQTIYMNYSFTDDQNNIDTQFISLTSPFRTNITSSTYFEFTFPFENAGASIPYNLTFFVNDTEGLEINQTFTFTVLPQATAPVISNVEVDFSNGTTISPLENTTYTFFENQNATIRFNYNDVNNNEDVIRINNGTSWVLGNETTINTTYQTVSLGNSQDYDIILFVNDSTSLTRYYNFTLQLLNNTAPDITVGGTDIDADELSSPYLENQTIDFILNSLTDTESDVVLVNISLYKQAQGGFNYINSTQVSPVALPTTLSHYFAIGERGTYRISFYAEDGEGLSDRLNLTTFDIEGENVAPFIENISIQSTFFADENLSSLELFTTQEGDTITISFDAYDIDNVSEAEGRIDLLRVQADGSTVASQNFVSPTSTASLSYLWNIQFTEAGYYEIDLLASDKGGLEGSELIYVNVTDNVAPVITVFNASNETQIPKLSFSEGETINFTFNVTEPNLYENFNSYTIYKNGTPITSGSLSSNGSFSSVFNYSSSGYFNYTLTVNDTQGLTNSAELFITVNPVEFDPVIDATTFNNGSGTVNLLQGQSVTAYEDDTITFRFNSSDINEDDILSYSISANSSLQGLTAFTNDSTIELTDWNDEGSYNITYFVNDSTGRNDSFWFILEIINNTAPVINFSSILNSTGGTTYYENDTITLNFTYYDSQSNVDDYYIVFDEVQYDVTSQAIFIDFLESGLYNYTFFVNDTQGLNDTITSNITVLQSNRNPVIDYAYYNNGSSEVSLTGGEVVTMYENTGATIGFNASDINGNIANYYINSTPSLQGLAVSTNESSFTLTGWDDAGEYEVTLFVNDSTGLNDTLQFTITVIDNTAPYEVSRSFTNSTGGTYLSENDSINIQFEFKDNQSNYDSASLYYDGALISSSITDVGANKRITGFVPLSLTSSGNHTITLIANDTQNLVINGSNVTYTVYVNDTLVAPVITDMRIFYDNTLTRVNNGQVFNVFEGKSFYFTFEAEDENTDETVSQLIEVNVTPEVNDTDYDLLWTIGFLDSGLRNLSATVTDEFGLSDTQYVILNISENLAPNISEFIVINANGSANISEGDYVNITYNVTDQQENLDTVLLTYNGTLIGIYTNYLRTTQIFIPFTDRGFQNFTINATDEEGLSSINSSLIEILPTEVAPVIQFANINRSLTNNTQITNFSTNPVLYATTGDVINISFFATDINGNSTIDSYWIERNDTIVNISTFYSFTFIGAIQQNFTLFVNDSSGLITNGSFSIRNGTNVAPIIENLSIVDSESGLTEYFENATINITYDVFDADGNIQSQVIRLNGTQIGTSNGTQRFFDFESAGEYNITINVTDFEGASASVSQLITVQQTNVSPSIGTVIVNANGTNVNPSPNHVISSFEGDTITISFNASDVNNDIDRYITYRNGTSIGGNQTVWNVNYTAEGYYNVTLFVNDSTDLNDTFTFFVNITDNLPAINISLNVTNSTGGTTFVGGDTIAIYANATDPEGQDLTYVISYDGVSLGPGQSKNVNLNDLTFDDRNISVQVYDGELTVINWTIITINKKQLAPELENITVESQILSETDFPPTNSLVSIQEGETLNISTQVTDFNNDYNRTSFTRYKFNSTLGWLVQSASTSDSVLFSPGYNDIGLYKYEIVVYDDLDQTDSGNISINVTDNLAPQITSVTILNSTGGNYYSEGDLLSVEINFTEIHSDEGSFEMTFDDSVISTSRIGSRILATINLGLDSRGTYNLSSVIFDGEGLNATNISEVVVNATLVSPSIVPSSVIVEYRNGTAVNPSPGQVLYAEESDGAYLNYLNVTYVTSDDNGNGTIISNELLLNGMNVSSIELNYSSQGYYPVVLNVTDSDGLSSNFTFYLNVTDNIAPEIIVNITNSTNGNLTFVQGDIANITVIATDSNNNFNVTKIFVDDQEVNSQQNGLTYNFTLDLTNYANETINISVIAYDYEGLNISYNSSIYVNSSTLPPTITSVNVSTPFISYTGVSDGDVLTLYENASGNISFSATDPNVDDSLDYEIWIDGSQVSSNSSFNGSFGISGIVPVIVNVTDGIYVRNISFSFNLSENSAPSISNIIITNSTGGTTYYEGDALTFVVNATDANNNIQTYITNLSKNTSGYFINSQNIFGFENYSWQYQLNGSNVSYSLPGFTAGIVNVTVLVVDSFGSNDTLQSNITVLNKEFSPTISGAYAEDEVVSDGALIAKFNPGNTVTLAFTPEDNDLNGEFVYIQIDDVLYNVSNYSFSIPSGTVGTTYAITYFVNDSTGYNDTVSYNLKVVAKNTQTVTVRSSGGGGGGGGSAPAPKTSADVEIKNPSPVSISKGEERIQTITISNPGTRSLLVTELIPNYNPNLFDLEFIDDTTNLTLQANESREIRVRLVNKEDSLESSISFTVKGVSGGQVTTDEAVLYVNSLASDLADVDSEFLQLLQYVRNVVNDNPQCLELIDLVSKGEQAFESGNRGEAMSSLRDARDQCLQLTRSGIESINAEIIQESGELRNLIIQGLIIVLILLTLPSIYLYFKGRKEKDVDVKEQEIEDWLDDFYKK